MALFSLSANAGAALTAAVVQPGAAGLNIAFKDPNVTVTSNSIEGAIAASGGRCGESDTRGGSSKSRKERGPGGVGGFGYETGVVFESLDSRILEEALVSSMARLGLGISRRSRWGRCQADCKKITKGVLYEVFQEIHNRSVFFFV